MGFLRLRCIQWLRITVYSFLCNRRSCISSVSSIFNSSRHNNHERFIFLPLGKILLLLLLPWLHLYCEIIHPWLSILFPCYLWARSFPGTYLSYCADEAYTDLCYAESHQQRTESFQSFSKFLGNTKQTEFCCPKDEKEPLESYPLATPAFMRNVV